MSQTVNLSFSPDDIKREWRCSGCGVLSPNKESRCDCPTGVVYREANGTFERAWKIYSEDAMVVVAEQAGDEKLWFVAQTPGEDILQRALRRLHAAVEGKWPEQCVIDVLSD